MLEGTDNASPSTASAYEQTLFEPFEPDLLLASDAVGEFEADATPTGRTLYRPERRKPRGAIKAVPTLLDNGIQGTCLVASRD